MTRKLAEWSSEHGQNTKIGLSDGYESTTIPMVVPFWYDRPGFKGYPGNVRLLAGHARSARPTIVDVLPFPCVLVWWHHRSEGPVALSNKNE